MGILQMALKYEISCMRLNTMKISIDTLTENLVSYTMKYRGMKVNALKFRLKGFANEQTI